MRNNENIIFIDHKGKSHNARVQSFREHRDAKDALIHHEPLVTLNYNGGPGGEPVTLIDVPHISHPNRQENNPDLPSYPLHAWKREEEEHLELPGDHPVHDHFNEQPARDEHGNIVPKRRPLHEAHIAAHREKRAQVTEGTTTGVTSDGTAKAHLVGVRGANLPASASATLESYLQVGHPAHPETAKFPFTCESCGASVTRTASHHGGKQWQRVALTLQNASHDFHPGDKEWQEHVCKQEDIDAFRKKLEDAKKPAVVELSASEKLAAGEQLTPEVSKPTRAVEIEIVEPSDSERASANAYFSPAKEPDVIAELEKAPPAPNEPESKPEDAA